MSVVYSKSNPSITSRSAFADSWSLASSSVDSGAGTWYSMPFFADHGGHAQHHVVQAVHAVLEFDTGRMGFSSRTMASQMRFTDMAMRSRWLSSSR